MAAAHRCLLLALLCSGVDTGLAASTATTAQAQTKALRICRPPPPRPSSTALPVCLVVGDSVSLGYTSPLTQLLNGTCSVVHAPFSGDGGACDTNYALECAELWLNSTLDGSPAPSYAAIVFNFGLHDTNDSGMPEESRDEYVPLDEYGENLLAFAAKIRAFQPKAKVGWLASTPMHFNMHLNDNVESYNALAKKKLVDGKVVDSYADLYASVVANCSTPPYFGSKLDPTAAHHCALISDNEEYHYNGAGWEYLAEEVATLLRKMLQGHDAPLGLPSAAAVATIVRGGVTTCADGVTRCPAGATCVADSFSNTKYGCCMVPNAVDCKDNWHCCASGTTCSYNATFEPKAGPSNPSGGGHHVCTPQGGAEVGL
jgi:hypothetical protein